MNIVCPYCKALRFSGENYNCCHNGKVKLAEPNEYPSELRELLSQTDTT